MYFFLKRNELIYRMKDKKIKSIKVRKIINTAALDISFISKSKSFWILSENFSINVLIS